MVQGLENKDRPTRVQTNPSTERLGPPARKAVLPKKREARVLPLPLSLLMPLLLPMNTARVRTNSKVCDITTIKTIANAQ